MCNRFIRTKKLFRERDDGDREDQKTSFLLQFLHHVMMDTDEKKS